MVGGIPSPLNNQLYFILQLFSLAFGSSPTSPSSAPGDLIVQDFAVIMIIAALMLIITHKLKQPMVIGYILAGMIIGPYTPPFSLISSIQTVNVLSELGIIMLLFVIGTEFPIAKLKSVSKISIIVALPESMGTLLIVFFISQTLGFSFFDSMFLALAMSITSTVVTIRILEELDIIRDRSSTMILGLAFGLSFAAKLLGLSVVIGAFLAGVLVAESKSAAVARVVTIPLRDVFSAIFFVSIGALMNVSLIPSFIIPAIILILTSFASKFLIITGTLLIKSKIDGTTALRTGLGLAASKGEMSLIIAKGGQDVGAISSSVLPILGVVTIITTFIAPYIIKFGNKIKVSESRSTTTT